MVERVAICRRLRCVEAKKLLLHEISWMGTDLSIPAVRELAKNPELEESADYALTLLQTVN